MQIVADFHCVPRFWCTESFKKANSYSWNSPAIIRLFQNSLFTLGCRKQHFLGSMVCLSEEGGRGEFASTAVRVCHLHHCSATFYNTEEKFVFIIKFILRPRHMTNTDMLFIGGAGESSWHFLECFVIFYHRTSIRFGITFCYFLKHCHIVGLTWLWLVQVFLVQLTRNDGL